jgi:hypothetical protein
MWADASLLPRYWALLQSSVLMRAVNVTSIRMVALGWLSGPCTGVLSQNFNVGYYTINEAQMCFLSELRMVFLPTA